MYFCPMDPEIRQDHPGICPRCGMALEPEIPSLDDGDSPMPTQKLSALQEVEVIARMSMGGDPMAQSGDLESPPVRVRLPAGAPIELIIGRVRE